ncbi:MAG TPA: hypothetical protein VMW43_09535 [Bacteroidota bacterium]|nr:hypothetical protein [Bacteroidota bacterium]
MKKISALLIVVLALWYSPVLRAQENPQKDSSSNDGRKALTFSFNGLNLGGGLGGTIWVSPTSNPFHRRFKNSF